MEASRPLLAVEAVAVLACLVIPWPVPAVLPLLVVASVARYARGQSWAAVSGGGAARWLVGVGVGIVALGLAVAVAGPVVEALGDRPVLWTGGPVRGSAPTLIAVALLVVASAAAAELALHGYVLERIAALSPGSPGLPIAVAAVVEAAATPGALAARAGALLVGGVLGALYWTGGRSVAAPLGARLGFGLGVIVLELLRVV